MFVNIRETLERVVEVESIEEAELKYKTGEFVLDAEDFKGVEFTEYEDSTDG